MAGSRSTGQRRPLDQRVSWREQAGTPQRLNTADAKASITVEVRYWGDYCAGISQVITDLHDPRWNLFGNREPKLDNTANLPIRRANQSV